MIIVSGKDSSILKEQVDRTKESHRMGKKSNLNLQYFKLENPTSLCEALREISNIFDIRDDFILLHGDIVSNLDLKPALEMHYHAKQESKEF